LTARPFTAIVLAAFMTYTPLRGDSTREALPDEAGAAPPLRSRAASPRTIPEQIADELGAMILDGRYATGDRLVEQELAANFGVSRGPVREALRILEKRRLVEVRPRRGAYVRRVSIDAFADLSNVRIALATLAVRLMAARPAASYVETLRRRVEEVEAAAETLSVPPFAVGQLIFRIVITVARGSGNDLVLGLLLDLANETIWTTIWRQPLDYQTTAVRRRYARALRQMLRAIERQDADEAARHLRQVLESIRDTAVATLRRQRRETADRAKLVPVA
jgi:DNA-binding GntR family transcriptional regulator